MATEAEARQSTKRLIRASKEFLDAFAHWETVTHLDAGGGVRSSRPTAPPGEQIAELLEGARSMLDLNDELRHLLKQVAGQLTNRGFIGRSESQEG